MTCCPTCGAEMRGRGWLVDKDGQRLIGPGGVVSLTGHIGEVFWALYRWRGSTLHRDRLIALLWADADDEPEDAGLALRVTVHRLRRRLEASPWSVETVGRDGYRLKESPA